jgi:(1->4)-alpha-D-glucan 1-alpha-D-glucosylmutase
MISTSTHDTKRGEDAAARLAVISELAEEWCEAVTRWSRLTLSFKVKVDGELAPGHGLEYLFYQTLVGTWPFGWDGTTGREAFAVRIVGYLRKAAKEAKEHTSWTNPNIAYDQAVEAFAHAALGSRTFMSEVRAFADRIAPFGASNALGGVVLRLCSPGISDTYQGCELWNQSLVDPDNRQPIDFGTRLTMLRALTAAPLDRGRVRDLRDHYQDARIKMFVTASLLLARKNHRELFLRGDYRPLASSDHVIAFQRSFEERRLVVLVTRLPLLRTAGTAPWAIGEIWGDDSQELPSGRYRSLFTSETLESSGRIALARAFADLPVAVFLSKGD